MPRLQEILGHFQNEQNIKGMILLRAFQKKEIKLQKNDVFGNLEVNYWHGLFDQLPEHFHVEYMQQ